MSSISRRSRSANLMLRAAAKGDVVTMHSLIKRKGIGFLHISGPDGTTPLHLACRRGQRNAVEYLLKFGVSLYDKDHDPKRQGNGIHYACWGGQIDLLRWMIEEHKVDLGSTDIVGNTPLLYAIYGGHRHVVEELVRRGRSLRERNSKNHTAILQAACGGHLDLVDWLFTQGFSVTETDHDGNTALLFAAWGGHRELMEYLLQRGASLDEKNFNGHSVFLSAANGGRLEIVEWLLDEGFSLSETNNNGDTALLLAAYGGHLPLAKRLLELGASMDERNGCGFTPLLSAANGGQLEMSAWLLSHGASLDEADNDGYTSLILAACGGNIDLVKFFIAQGASIHERNANGDTPLLLASYCGHAELVAWLLDHGSNLDEHNNTQMGPLISAANGGHLAVVELLLERLRSRQALEEQDEGGYTPLLLAAQRGHFAVVQYLAAMGANLKAHTRRGNTASILAMDFPEIQQYLAYVKDMTPLEIAIDARMTDRIHDLIVRGIDIPMNAIKVATTTGTYPGAREPDEELVRLLQAAQLPWAPCRRALYGPGFQQCVFNVLALEKMLSKSQHLPVLPHEVWLMIAGHVQRSWFVNSDELATAAPRTHNRKSLAHWRRIELLGENVSRLSVDVEMSASDEEDVCFSLSSLQFEGRVTPLLGLESNDIAEEHDGDRKFVDAEEASLLQMQRVSWV